MEKYEDVQLSEHFKLSEFIKTSTGIPNDPRNYDGWERVIRNLKRLCRDVLEPARSRINAPIFITSGYRCKEVNKAVGGNKFSQHMDGEAADITVKNPAKFKELVDFLASSPAVDQLLTASTWLHVSIALRPRMMVRIGFYK